MFALLDFEQKSAPPHYPAPRRGVGLISGALVYFDNFWSCLPGRLELGAELLRIDPTRETRVLSA